MRILLLTLILAACAKAQGQTTTSPNMGMPVPVVGTTPGPAWANDINASLSIIDSHNHTPGQGVPIPPAGLNINSDLTFQGNNATNLRSTRFSSQVSTPGGASDLGELYEQGVDLYYIDGSGNNVRITQSGSVTGSAGTITGLPSGTASASFSGGTFTFNSATSTPATMAVGPVKVGAAAANSKTVTITPPGGLAANYTMTLPSAVPGSTSFLDMDISGNLSTVATTGSGNVCLATSPSLSSPTIAGGALSGTFTGSPTFSGGPTISGGTYSGGGALAGTFSGTPTYSGTPTFSAGMLSTSGTAGGPAYSFSGDATTGVYRSGAGTVSVSSAGTDIMDVNSSGITLAGFATGGNVPHACTIRSNGPSSIVCSTGISVSCNAGEIVTGGGCSTSTTSGTQSNYPASSTQWQCVWGQGGTCSSAVAYAICCKY